LAFYIYYYYYYYFNYLLVTINNLMALMYILYPHPPIINNPIYIIQISSMNINLHIISIIFTFSITSIVLSYPLPIIFIMSYIIYLSIIITFFTS